MLFRYNEFLIGTVIEVIVAGEVHVFVVIDAKFFNVKWFVE